MQTRRRWLSMGETLADKVNWLFTHIEDVETGRLMNTPLVAAKMRHLGVDVSDNTIRNVRTGDVERPSWPVIEGLAKVFRVAPGFFSSDATIHDLEKQLVALDLLSDTKLWNLVQRAVGVSPEGVGMAADVALVVLERYREMEGLNAARPALSATPAAPAARGSPPARRTPPRGRGASRPPRGDVARRRTESGSSAPLARREE